MAGLRVHLLLRPARHAFSQLPAARAFLALPFLGQLEHPEHRLGLGFVREGVLRDILEQLGVADEGFVWRGRTGSPERDADLVANPGCYPTSVQLGFVPLLEQGAIDPERLIADAKSGVSGAGPNTPASAPASMKWSSAAACSRSDAR